MSEPLRLPQYDWKLLEKRAVEIVESSIRSLPIELKTLAVEVPVVCRKWHPDALEGNAQATELLGEYLSFEGNRIGEENGPIILYLGAIQLFCKEEKAPFDEELRLTYLHELGHHFGWDEDELEQRGLG